VTTYKWIVGRRLGKFDPQPVGERIAALRKKNDGVCSAETYRRDALKKSSPLYPTIEHDAKEALREHQLAQARLVLRSCVAVSTRKMMPAERKSFYVKREHIITSSRMVHTDALGGYAELSVVRRNKTAREETLATAWRELQAWRERWADLSKELGAVFKAIDRLAKRRK
jgi:hypothetical protein